ncbi:MAG: hypothetical protein DRJ38_07615 [Thermoprotei archaeon]|nr:MAG: hypothetical protein DRJ38_07615 [Thermoprotei archaeon]
MNLRIGITQADWKIIQATPKSITIKEIAEKSQLSRPYVSLRLQKLREDFKIHISFKPILKKLGLKPVISIYPLSKQLLEKFEEGTPYTTSVSHLIKSTLDGLIVFAYVPEEYVDEYLALLPEKPVKTYIGERIVKWRPDLSKATWYHRKRIGVNWNTVRELAKSAEYIEEDLSKIPIDSLDMFIIKEKEKWAYTPLTKISEILEKSISIGNIKKKASPQLLEYHWKKHVLKAWDFNQVKIILPLEVAPITFHYIRFRDEDSLYAFLHAFSRNAVYNSTTVILEDKASVFTAVKVPCAEMIEFMKFVHSLGVEEYSSEGFMDTDIILRYTITYAMLKRGKWYSPLELLELYQRK